ncbi:FAD-dependent oxidoreductase [Catenuloplanes japonicus]|uniref:FAD-dependent oxidoreductase n=1 Tax=Catenuloplanes japonicus TaxID=33876 RepID=UPI000526B842|nr:FAD-dependent oxidoreductase [Catenuloplanes japonicus]
MARSGIDVLVIGAGVSGITTALRLAERGHRVLIRARELPHESTSCAAGALWGPVVAEHERVTEWSDETLEAFRTLAAHPEAGVRLVQGLEASHTGMAPPVWLRDLPDLTLADPATLPAGYLSGWRYTAPIVDMPVYLTYLVLRAKDAGVQIEQGEAASLTEVPAGFDVLVNCTGADARALVPDPEVVPVRGQLVVVENPGIDEFFADAEDAAEMTYFLPHGDRMVLGSTAHPARTDRAWDPALAERIVARCAEVRPELAGARVLDHRVGFRPTRSRVRVEREAIPGGHLVHNYGHGGGGVSLSWGCASAAADLVEAP